jgi:hypothetical protein
MKAARRKDTRGGKRKNRGERKSNAKHRRRAKAEKRMKRGRHVLGQGESGGAKDRPIIIAKEEEEEGTTWENEARMESKRSIISQM